MKSNKRIMFVCHGNICRSPLAEFVMKDLVKRQGLENSFIIESAATSFEEIGNPIYPPIKEVMRAHNIPFGDHRATRLKETDYEKYDLFVIMDKNNECNIRRIFADDKDNKIRTLLSFAGEQRDVADPWYYGNFETTYKDILKGTQALLRYLVKT